MSVPQPPALKPCLLPWKLLLPMWWGVVSALPLWDRLRERKGHWEEDPPPQGLQHSGLCPGLPAGSQVGQLSPPLTRMGPWGSDGRAYDRPRTAATLPRQVLSVCLLVDQPLPPSTGWTCSVVRLRLGKEFSS